MASYIVQVYHDNNVEYRTVEASSYEEARDKVASQVTLGRIIAIQKRKSND